VLAPKTCARCSASSIGSRRKIDPASEADRLQQARLNVKGNLENPNALLRLAKKALNWMKPVAKESSAPEWPRTHPIGSDPRPDQASLEPRMERRVVRLIALGKIRPLSCLSLPSALFFMSEFPTLTLLDFCNERYAIC
jgi:hypothetical protein